MANRTSLIWPFYSPFATPYSPACLSHRLLGLFGALALVGVEELLAQPDRFRGHLDQFVVLDIGQRLFQGHLDRRGQAHRFVLRGGADVGELLALQDVDLEVVVAGVLADDHALVDLAAGRDHHRAAVLQLEHRVGHGLALIVGDQDAVAAALDVALVGRVIVEQAVHDGGAAGVGQQFALIADQATGRRVEHQPLPVTAGGTHLDQLGLAFAHLLHHDAGMLFVDVDHDLLDRLPPIARGFVFSQHDAGTRHRQLETFAAHGLDQDAELQFAASGDFHRVVVIRFANPQRHIAFGFTQQSVADHAASDLRAFGASQRGIVDAKRHRQCWWIDRLRLDRQFHRGIADGVSDGGVRQAGERDDVPGFRLFHGGAFNAAESQHLGNTAGLDQLAFMIEYLDALVGLDRSRSNASGDDAAEIVIGFQDGAEQAERAFLHHRRLDVAEDQIEQRLHAVVVRTLKRRRHPALLGRAVENREIELLLAGVEGGEQIEHFVDDFDRARVGAVDLVDDDDGLETHPQRLRDHEFGLRQRTLGRVDQHQRAVHHVENTLDLAAEIGMARGVDDVDAGVLPLHRRRLGQNGNAALALQIVGIHCALNLALVVAVDAGLLQQAVDQRGLAVVDVGDDGDVAEVHSSSSGSGNGWSTISPENRDPLFRITLKAWNSKGA